MIGYQQVGLVHFDFPLLIMTQSQGSCHDILSFILIHLNLFPATLVLGKDPATALSVLRVRESESRLVVGVVASWGRWQIKSFQYDSH